MYNKLLKIEDLELSFKMYEGISYVLKKINLDLNKGEKVALVGESGSGKSVTTKLILGLLNQKNVTKKGKILFNSNNSGGILGGISTGQKIVARFVVKATSSILKKRNTITKNKKNTTVSVGGRHDPCVGIRAVPIGEAMLACVLADHFLRNKVFQN